MHPGRMLATDLDGTFIGDDDAMLRLWRDLEAERVLLVFSTGRHLPSIEAFYAEQGGDPRADACVCMVGTEIWELRDGHYERDDGWSRLIAEAWDKSAVEAILRSIPEAVVQPAEWQSEFKSSYFLEENTERRLEEISTGLEREGLQAKVVYSARRFLDLLPVRSGKGGAVSYLASTLGIGADEVITAGDTGNDLDMMRRELGFRCIAVGNSADELRGVIEPQIYHARASYAAGIAEGLEHYGWLDRSVANQRDE
jgi:sucrose-phosphate synthase